MVIKLIKHELKALFRTLLYLGAVAVVLSVIGRIFMATDPEGLFGILFGIIAIYLAVIVSAAAVLTSVQRFYRSLFKGEGYMTFSLPVKPTQLILSKFLSALIASLFGVVVAVVTCLIFFSGLGAEFWVQMGNFFGNMGAYVQSIFSSDPLLAVEGVLAFIAGIPMTLFFFYSVICIGQLFTAHRVGITFGIGIGVLIVLSILEGYCIDPLVTLMAERVSPHLGMWFTIILYIGADVGMFFFIRYILSNKVNLIV